jgi:hypothetical protein
MRSERQDLSFVGLNHFICGRLARGLVRLNVCDRQYELDRALVRRTSPRAKRTLFLTSRLSILAKQLQVNAFPSVHHSFPRV